MMDRLTFEFNLIKLVKASIFNSLVGTDLARFDSLAFEYVNILSSVGEIPRIECLCVETDETMFDWLCDQEWTTGCNRLVSYEGPSQIRFTINIVGNDTTDVLYETKITNWKSRFSQINAL